MPPPPRSYVLKKEFDVYLRVCARHAKFNIFGQRVLVRRVLQNVVPPVYFMKREYDLHGLRHASREHICSAVYLETLRRNERWAMFRLRKLVPMILSYLYRPGASGFLRCRNSFLKNQARPVPRLSQACQ